jgi:rod shape determining protein RodA
VGCSLIIATYASLTLRTLYLANQNQETFSRLVGGCFSMMLFSSAFVNICMVTGILPVVGIPLPLISYGGTSMVTFMMAMGVMISLNHHKRFLPH